jgi:hypothetical protein
MKEVCVIVLLLSLTWSCRNEVKTEEPLPPRKVQVKKPVELGAESFRWTTIDSIVRGVDVPFAFTNTSADTMYMINCNGALSPVLEKSTGSGWEVFLLAASNACLSAPIVILPGAALEDTLYLRGALPDNNAGPAFPSKDITGQYRVSFSGMVWHYNTGRQNFGDTIPFELRCSAPFFISE